MIAPCPQTPDSPSPDAPPRRRSGGPRTPEGKARSRKNALKHGLRAELLLPDDMAEAVVTRTNELAAQLSPTTPNEEWLVGRMALHAVRLDRLAELAVADLGRQIERAETRWDADRRLDAEELGSRLPRDPSRVSTALAATRQGADWLIRRWEGLGAALEKKGGWDESQRQLAMDLMGTPPALRDAALPADAAGLAEIVSDRLSCLTEERDNALAELDESDRGLTGLGLPIHEDATTRRLKRYESAEQRAYERHRAEFRRLHPEPAARPSAGRPPRRSRVDAATSDDRILLAPLYGVGQVPPVPQAASPSPSPAARPIVLASVAPAPAKGNRHERRRREALARKAR